MEHVRIGMIGGSGLYQMPELTNVEEVHVDTPFGSPSDSFVIGTLENERVAFLPRHGRGHRLTPTEVPFRANIYAMKLDRKSTRLNSSHTVISYAVFCLKKKK